MYGTITFHHNISCSLKCTLWYQSLTPQILFRICYASIAVCAHAQSSIRALSSTHPFDVCTSAQFLHSQFFFIHNFSSFTKHQQHTGLASKVPCAQSHSRLRLAQFPLAPTILTWTATSNYPLLSQPISVKTVLAIK
jgi:hypothetical protein